MKAFAFGCLLLCLTTACGSLLTPDERAELRARAQAERDFVAQQLEDGVITEEQAEDRFLLIDGAEFGLDLDERAGSSEPYVDLLSGGIALGLGLLGVPAVGFARRRVRASRQRHDQEIAVAVKDALSRDGSADVTA